MFTVQQRAREFSVRLAVGASAADLLRLVLGGGLKLTAIGVAIGAGRIGGIGAIADDAAVRRTAVRSGDVRRRAAGADVVALLACLAPALRALRADPVAALRCGNEDWPRPVEVGALPGSKFR